jgi:hypothetical protein
MVSLEIYPLCSLNKSINRQISLSHILHNVKHNRLPKRLLDVRRMTFIHSIMNGSTTLCWALASSSISQSFFTQTVGILGEGIRSSQDRYMHTGQHKHRINAHTDIHVLSEIWIHGPSFRANEDNSCLFLSVCLGRSWVPRYICFKSLGVY